MNCLPFIALTSLIMTIALGVRAYGSGPSNATADETTICSIRSDPRAYDGKAASFEGWIESDGIEWVGATDRKCPDVNVGLVIPRSAGDADDINALHQAIFGLWAPGTIDKDIFARIIGTMKYDPKERSHFSIDVKKVQDMRVSRKTVD